MSLEIINSADWLCAFVIIINRRGVVYQGAVICKGRADPDHDQVKWGLSAEFY